MFPVERMRRLRTSQELRDLVSETTINLNKLVMPVFVDETLKNPQEIRSMPGIYSYDPDSVDDYAEKLRNMGIRNVLVFGVPSAKDPMGTEAYNPEGVSQKAIRKFAEKGLVVMADLCMCEYTDHGHCGVLKEKTVHNDETIKLYGKIAVSQARAGAHVIAPSGMMDGQVKAIREALDSDGFSDTPIMAYSAKYASQMYGPFRDAAKSTPSFGDRKTYQMNPSNAREAIREMELDIIEGADIIMVKPALFYLDVLKEARNRFNLPISAYGVSGEYSMIKNAVDSGLLGEDAISEYILSVFRAGADIFITYFAEYLAQKGQHRVRV